MAAFDVETIDEVIHGRMRLGIMAYLAGAEAADFTELKDALKATQGNLSIHLRKLEDAGYLKSETTGNGRASRTSIALTRHGRAALDTYTEALRDLLGGL